MKKVNEKGFTLAELLIVVAIIAVLVGVAIPTFAGRLEVAREGVDASNVRGLYATAQADVLTSGFKDATKYTPDNADNPTKYTGYYDTKTGEILPTAYGIKGYGRSQQSGFQGDTPDLPGDNTMIPWSSTGDNVVDKVLKLEITAPNSTAGTSAKVNTITWDDAKKLLNLTAKTDTITITLGADGAAPTTAWTGSAFVSAAKDDKGNTVTLTDLKPAADVLLGGDLVLKENKSYGFAGDATKASAAAAHDVTLALTNADGSAGAVITVKVEIKEG